MIDVDRYAGHLFVFRGRRGDLIKVIWHDGQGACLFSKRLERGRFIWPTPADGAVSISPAQVDAYSGYNALYAEGRKPGPIVEAACWAHGRRKLYELARLTQMPISIEAVRRIDELFRH